LIDTAITRLREQAGERNPDWRLPRARYLLRFEDTEDAAREAASLLNELTDTLDDSAAVRRTLARAYQRLGNRTARRRQLEAARRLGGDPAVVNLQLARLYQQQDEQSAARGAIQRAVGTPELSPAQRREATRMLAELDRPQQAINLLEDLPAAQREPADNVLLARLHYEQGQLDRAGELARALLEQPSPQGLEFAAHFFAAQNERDLAGQALDRLNELDELPPGLLPLIRGGFQARYGEAEQALSHFEAAIEQAPDRPQVHRARIVQLLRLGRFDEAETAVNEAAEACPDARSIQQLKDNWELAAFASDAPLLQPLALALAENPDQAGAAARALELLRDAEETEAPADRTLRQLRQLADRNPRFYPLQLLAIRLHQANGQPDRTASLAQRAMRLFPDAAAPAGLAAEAYAAAGNWQASLNAGQAWRQRSDQPQAPDQVIAEARMRLGQARQAADRLQPHLETALENPDRHPRLILQQARARIGAGDVEEAAELLKPMLEDSAEWRNRYMRLALTSLPQYQQARDWLERAANRIPEDAAQERLQLASLWRALARRFDESTPLDRAEQTLQALADREDPPAGVFLRLGMLADARGRLETAVEHYQRAIERDAEQPLAANNLAMVLLRRENGDLDRALQLAERAVELAPEAAIFQDTLARVHARRGEYDPAIDAMNEAVNLEQNNPRWRVSLAELHTQTENYDQARQLIDQIEPQAAEQLAEPVRQTLADVENTLDTAEPAVQ